MSHIKRRFHLYLISLAAAGCILLPEVLRAQDVWTVMPMGNSITWGKVDRQAPPAGTHGYRKELFDQLVGNAYDFVGPGAAYVGNGALAYGSYYDSPYEGYFIDGRRIGEFLPGATWDVQHALNYISTTQGPDSIPEVVILHIGTNNMYDSTEVGIWSSPGTVVNQLYQLVNTLLDYSASGHRVEHLLLCKIIPFSPFEEMPNLNQRVLDYNAGIEEMVANMDPLKRNRIEIVDMYSPFLANEDAYYNNDIDHTHPNLVGYKAMGEILGYYVRKIFVPSYRDNFTGAGGQLNGVNRWYADPEIRIYGPDDAIYCDETVTSEWEHLAIWAKSQDANAVTMGIMDEDTGLEIGNLNMMAMAIGLNDTTPATADGYMVWITGNTLRIYTITNGQAGTNAIYGATSWPMTGYGPGDSLRVQFVPGETGNNFNTFIIQVNQNATVTLRHNTTTWGREAGGWDHYYSGYLFKGQSGVPPAQNSAMSHFFKVETQLPDITPPGQIADLSVFDAGNNSITLIWTAPGNDGYLGKASSYDLRISTSPITTANFDQANIVVGVPVPLEVNNNETFTITGLLSGAHYYFAIKATDSWGNTGDMSNQADQVTDAGGQVVHSFNTVKDWLLDPKDHAFLDTSGTGLLVSTQGDGTWPSSVAVYTGRTNPETVSMVWGPQVTPGPFEDNENGGLALMLNDDDTDADGYLVFVRTKYQIIYLYAIEDGQVGDPLDVVSYTVKDGGGDPLYPGDGDTLSVVLNWNNPSYNKFEVYMNSEPAGERALYDDEKRRSGAGTMYSGIMLTHMYGPPGRNNFVDAFIVSSNLREGGYINYYEIASELEGTVNDTLDDELSVVVTDVNQNPMPGVPVYFQVTADRDGGTVTAPPVITDPVRLEAEWGKITVLSGGSMNKLDHISASRGTYVVSPGGSARTSYVEFKFRVYETAEYYFWGRVVAPSQYQAILWFELDGTPNLGFAWQALEGNYSTSEYDWEWDRVRQFGQTVPYKRSLSPGMHTLRLYKGHDNVKIDKIAITRNGAFRPSGMDTVATLFSNSQGIARTKWNLGRQAGENQVEAYAYGINQKLTFTATGRPDDPLAIYPVGVSTQTGVARDTLATPFTCRLEDPYGNITPDQIVNWQIVRGDGFVTRAVDTTDAGGLAETYLVLGIQDTITQVKPVFTGYTGPDIVYTGRATSGLVKTLQIQTGTGAGQKHYVGTSYPNLLKVRILDDQNKPVDNTAVTFQVTQGSGLATLGRQPKMTDSDGIAQDTLTYGPTAGVVTVTANVSRLSAVALKDSAFYRGAKCSYYGGATQGFVNDTLQYRLKVRVLDVFNTPVSNHPVTFATHGSGFRFPNGTESRVVMTNGSGIATTNVKLGLIHGVYPNIVSAWSSNGFDTIPDPVHFTVHAKSKASFLEKISADSIEGVVNELLETPVRVQMLTTSRLPVMSQPVDFIIKSGGGQFEGTLADTLRVMTDGDGFAQVLFILGPGAGDYNNIVEAHATNGVSVLTGSPVRYRFSARSSEAFAMHAFSDTVFTGTAGKSLTKKVQVQLTDQLGNPVTGENVTYTIKSGGGTLNGVSSSSKTILVNNAGGLAEVEWTLGPMAGTSNNVLEAEASNGLLPLEGSPLRFYASALPGSVSDTTSVVDVTTPVRADLQDTSWVTITLRDKYGNPVPNKRIDLSAIGSGINIVVDPTLPTGTDGKAFGYILSNTSGIKTIHAKVIGDNITLQDTAVVTFLANSAQRLKSHTGDQQHGNVGTVLRDSLVVQVIDANNNPVQYQAVTFERVTTGCTILEPQPVVTDANGLASSYLVLGTEVKNYVVKVSSEKADGSKLEGSPVYFSADAIQGEAKIMDYDGDFPSVQTGAAGETFAKPFVIMVTDINGAPVSGTGITFTVQQGGATPAVQTVVSDQFGLARAWFKADPVVGGQKTLIVATNASLSGSPKIFEAVSVAGDARKIQVYTGNYQSAYVGDSFANPVTARVTDSPGNPVPGISVQFDVVSGDASIGGAQSATVQSDANGLAAIQVRAGQTTGTVTIEAVSRFLEGSPVKFTLYVSTIQAQTIKKINSNLKGTLGMLLPDPLMVQLLDKYGNPVPNVSINFFKSDGAGMVEDDQPRFSDDRGIASCRFRVGNTPGGSQVKAVLGVGKEVTFNIEAVINSNYPVLDKTLIPDQRTVFENSRMDEVVLVASDLDGDALTFEIADPFPPEGAVVHQQSPLTATFEWTPSFGQDGTYHIPLRVRDGKGGWDADTVRVVVLNTSRPPTIDGSVPAAADTILPEGQVFPFFVDASDPDGDELVYSWEVDGVSASGTESVFYWDIPCGSLGFHIIDVYVSDGSVSANKRWTILVTSNPNCTSVALTALAGIFDPDKAAVILQWETSEEVNNAGFHVLRSRFEDGIYHRITEDLVPASQDGRYEYTDADVEVDLTYYYKLVAVSTEGVESEHGLLTVTAPRPKEFRLHQNYPNPFNPVTKIRFELPEPAHVSLSIYNIMGQRVITLIDRPMEAGYHTEDWHGSDENGLQVTTGLYIYQLRTEGRVITKRMIKMK